MIKTPKIHEAKTDKIERIDRKFNNRRDFSTLLLIMDKTAKQNINKEKEDLIKTLNQLGLTDNSRTFHPTTEEYIFFKSEHRTLFQIAHI